MPFVRHGPPCLGSESLTGRLIDLARLAGQRAHGSACLHLPSTQVTGVHTTPGSFCEFLGSNSGPNARNMLTD